MIKSGQVRLIQMGSDRSIFSKLTKTSASVQGFVHNFKMHDIFEKPLSSDKDSQLNLTLTECGQIICENLFRILPCRFFAETIRFVIRIIRDLLLTGIANYLLKLSVQSKICGSILYSLEQNFMISIFGMMISGC